MKRTSLLIAAVVAALLGASCGGDEPTRQTSAADFAGLCAANAAAAAGNATTAIATFDHGPLHSLAASAEKKNRQVAARLLEAKQKVEALTISPDMTAKTLDQALAALLNATRAAQTRHRSTGNHLCIGERRMKNLIRLTTLGVIVTLVTTACSSKDETKPKASDDTSATVVNAQVASFDLAANRPQRVIVGLLTNDNGLIVGGSVTVAFRRIGLGATPTASMQAPFMPVADAAPIADGPRLRGATESVGVYEVSDVVFDKPGNWEIRVVGTLKGKRFAAQSAFKVEAEPELPSVGDAAPRTENLLPGAADAPAKAVDSRAEANGAVPDSALHQMTVAAAIATKKPTMVVISTPVYCVSQFCGPITDTVQAIAGEFAGKANFVHIEVWRDFEKKELNRGAAEWMFPANSEGAREPWVFLVGADGTIVRRWDNVANGVVLRAALEQSLK